MVLVKRNTLRIEMRKIIDNLISGKNFKLLFILLIFFFSIIIFISLNNKFLAEWDEATYFKTNNFLKSFGEEGLLENLRPLGLSLILAISPFGTSIFNARLFSLILGIISLVLIKNLLIKILKLNYSKKSVFFLRYCLFLPLRYK